MVLYLVGAVWVRIMDDYGHIDDNTPSFAVSVLDNYRRQGIGSQLMVRIILIIFSALDNNFSKQLIHDHSLFFQTDFIFKESFKQSLILSKTVTDTCV